MYEPESRRWSVVHAVKTLFFLLYSSSKKRFAAVAEEAGLSQSENNTVLPSHPPQSHTTLLYDFSSYFLRIVNHSRFHSPCKVLSEITCTGIVKVWFSDRMQNFLMRGQDISSGNNKKQESQNEWIYLENEKIINSYYSSPQKTPT